MHVAEIRCYPVKSLRGISLQHALLEQTGVAGDRRWMIVDEANKFVTQRQHPKLAQIDAVITERGVELRHAKHGALEVPYPPAASPRDAVVVWRDTVQAQIASSASGYLSTFLGFPARLAFLHDVRARPIDRAFGQTGDRVSFADAFPYLVTLTASLDDLNRRLANPVSMDRFRASIVIGGGPAWAEDTWRLIRVGDVTMRIAKPCSRCAIPTLDPLTGERPDGNEPLQTLATFRRDAGGGIMFGQDAIAQTIGRVSVGDPVSVLDIGAPNVEAVVGKR